MQNKNTQPLWGIIDTFENNSIRYIFLLNHIEQDDKPEDIHFFISESDFEQAGKILESEGWFSWLEPGDGDISRNQKMLKLGIKSVFNPMKAAKFLKIEKKTSSKNY